MKANRLFAVLLAGSALCPLGRGVLAQPSTAGGAAPSTVQKDNGSTIQVGGVVVTTGAGGCGVVGSTGCALPTIYQDVFGRFPIHPQVQLPGDALYRCAATYPATVLLCAPGGAAVPMFGYTQADIELIGLPSGTTMTPQEGSDPTGATAFSTLIACQSNSAAGGCFGSWGNSFSLSNIRAHPSKSWLEFTATGLTSGQTMSVNVRLSAQGSPGNSTVPISPSLFPGSTINTTMPIACTSRTARGAALATSGPCGLNSNGALLVAQDALPGDTWRYAAASGGIVSSTSPVTLTGSAGTSQSNFVRVCTISSDSLSAATEVVILDGATVMARLKLQAGVNGPTTYTFNPPLAGSAATATTAEALTSVTGGIFLNCQGYKGFTT